MCDDPLNNFQAVKLAIFSILLTIRATNATTMELCNQMKFAMTELVPLVMRFDQAVNPDSSLLTNCVFLQLLVETKF